MIIFDEMLKNETFILKPTFKLCEFIFFRRDFQTLGHLSELLMSLSSIFMAINRLNK